jgi:plasmid stabilization system protein ParE
MRRATTNPAAREELREAILWYAATSSELALRFRTEVAIAVSRALDFPRSGSPAEPSLRQVRVDDFPYRVHYRVTTRGIRVLAVAHTSREPGYWRERR